MKQTETFSFNMRMLYISLLFLVGIVGNEPLFANNKENIDQIIEKGKEIIYTNPEQASIFAKQVMEMKGDAVDKSQMIEALYLYSASERLLGNFDSSIKALFDALELNDNSDKVIRGRITLAIGTLYSSLGDYSKAIEYNDIATAIAKAHNDSADIASCYNSRGIIHYSLDQFDIAEQFFQQSLFINRRLKRMKEIAGNLNNLCLYKGDFSTKLGYIQEAIAINKNLDAQWSLAENHNNLGKQLFYVGRYDEALKALDQSYEIANKIGAKELICDHYEYASWVYEAMGNYRAAYHALDQLYNLNRTLQRSNKLRSIEQDIAHQQLQMQKRRNEINEQNYRIDILKRNLILVLVASSLIAFIGFFLIKWYRRKKEIELVNTRYQLESTERENAELKIKQQNLDLENLKVILEEKRKDMTEFALFLKSQNELLDTIRNEIKEGYSMKGDEIKNHLKQINMFILQYKNSNKSNNRLLSNIEEQNQEFIHRLLSQHSNLTKGEQELSSLLRINLSTKDISIITGKSPKTIDMNRYRLRKTLNLSSEENINEYLQNI